jgi:hypothetical protein
MATQALRSIDVPRTVAGPPGRFPDLRAHRDRRRALGVLRALEAVGEPCTYRMVAPDGTAIPSDQVTDQDAAEVVDDLEHLATMVPTSLDALLEMLYAASSHSDRSRVAPALDRLLAYVGYWSVSSPERVTALFERLEPSRLVRAVGQTLLAATRLAGDRFVARHAFLARFLDDLRIRGTPDAVIARLRRGLEA